jgi:hypothetical protein
MMEAGGTDRVFTRIYFSDGGHADVAGDPDGVDVALNAGGGGFTSLATEHGGPRDLYVNRAQVVRFEAVPSGGEVQLD